MCVFWPFIVLSLITSVLAEIDHYRNFAFNAENTFQVTKTLSVDSKDICSVKCTKNKDQCIGFKYDQNSKICELGVIHPADIICNNDPTQIISIKMSLFELYEAVIFGFHNTIVEYYTLDVTLPEPTNAIPKEIPDWAAVETHFFQFIKFYTKGMVMIGIHLDDNTVLAGFNEFSF